MNIKVFLGYYFSFVKGCKLSFLDEIVWGFLMVGGEGIFIIVKGGKI